MKSDELDALFREAVSAVDAGDVGALKTLLAVHPELVHERLDSPGTWLSEIVGDALQGFFHRPYLLWFVAEDPVRNGRLPGNIASVTRAIVDAASREGVESLGEQLDTALRLVSWSWIARECGVQIELIDVLVDAGACPDGNPENALVNGNWAAADHLLRRGARLTLATALCLGRWDDAGGLAHGATAPEKQFAFVLAALKGKADALGWMIDLGIDIDAPSVDLFPHATPLHHAVCSGALEAVKVLVEAGAQLDAKDEAWKATPLNWAEHYGRREIVDYLREKQGPGSHWPTTEGS